MKRVYFSKVIKNQTDFAKKKIIQHERKTLMKMEQKKKLYVNLNFKFFLKSPKKLILKNLIKNFSQILKIMKYLNFDLKSEGITAKISPCKT